MFIQRGKQAIQQAQLYQLTIGDDQRFAPLFIRHEVRHIGNRAGAMQANFWQCQHKAHHYSPYNASALASGVTPKRLPSAISSSRVMVCFIPPIE